MAGVNFKKGGINAYIPFLLVFFLIFPSYADSAINRIPEKALKQTAVVFVNATTTAGNLLEVKINVDPGGQAINAAGILLQFSKDKLGVKKIERKNSFCELFIEEKFNNETGEVNVSCGKPYPGINKLSEIITIVFEKKENGWAELKFSDNSQVLANDGFGTNILKEINNKTILIN